MVFPAATEIKEFDFEVKSQKDKSGELIFVRREFVVSIASSPQSPLNRYFEPHREPIADQKLGHYPVGPVDHDRIKNQSAKREGFRLS